jgi:hypothetical protein
VAQAYTLPVSFSGTTASVNTQNSNCSTGNDYDFYKINLDQGYSYTIHAEVDDANYSGGTGSYTLDAIWSYSTDGNTWSDVYDDVDPDNIVMMNGGTMYFEVAPKFSGNTGTYMLVLNIQKNPFGVSQNGNTLLNIYPNPAKDLIYIEPASGYEWPSKVTLFSTQGKELITVLPGQKQDKIKMDVENLQDGLYLLRVYTNDAVLTRQVVIRK